MGIGAALHFQDAEDPSSLELQRLLAEQGVAQYLQNALELSEADARETAWYYQTLPALLS